MNYVIAPSILSADFANLGPEVRRVSEAGAQYIHIDVMDGMYVPNLTIGAPVISALRSYSDKVFDVHLMVEEPIRLLDGFVKAGADILTVHAEACRHLDRTVQAIRQAGLKAGVSLNPATPVSLIEDILGELDMVLVMSVNPGFGGQSFIPYTLKKLRRLCALREQNGWPYDIEIDGGVNFDNLDFILNAGANIIVAGSAVFKGEMGDNIKHFLQCFEKHCKSASSSIR